MMTGQGPLTDGALREGFRWQQRVVHNRKVCGTWWCVTEVARPRVLEREAQPSVGATAVSRWAPAAACVRRTPAFANEARNMGWRVYSTRTGNCVAAVDHASPALAGG
jgi:hypothetical protein